MAKTKEEFQNVLPHLTEFENEVKTWKVHITKVDHLDVESKNNLVNACDFAVKNQMPTSLRSCSCYSLSLLDHALVNGLSAL